jgi:hypothetical protein
MDQPGFARTAQSGRRRPGRRPPALSRDVELASELLDVVNDDELEWFLRGLVDEVAGTRRGRLTGARQRALLREVAGVASRTLPTLRAFVDGGWSAAEPPSAVATAAAVYGLELEGLSAEDRDFEIARQFVRFAEAAIDGAIVEREASSAHRGARSAVATAARRHAPGLLADGAVGRRPVGPGDTPASPCGFRDHRVEPQSNPTTRGVPHV